MSADIFQGRHYTRPNGTIILSRVKSAACSWYMPAGPKAYVRCGTLREHIDRALTLARQEQDRMVANPVAKSIDRVDRLITARVHRPDSPLREAAIQADHDWMPAYLCVGYHTHAMMLIDAAHRIGSLSVALTDVAEFCRRDPAEILAGALTHLIPVNRRAELAIEDLQEEMRWQMAGRVNVERRVA